MVRTLILNAFPGLNRLPSSKIQSLEMVYRIADLKEFNNQFNQCPVVKGLKARFFLFSRPDSELIFLNARPNLKEN